MTPDLVIDYALAFGLCGLIAIGLYGIGAGVHLAITAYWLDVWYRSNDDTPEPLPIEYGPEAIEPPHPPLVTKLTETQRPSPFADGYDPPLTDLVVPSAMESASEGDRG